MTKAIQAKPGKLERAARALRNRDLAPDDKRKAAEYLSSQRIRPGGGRPRLVKECPHECGESFSAREMRKHIPACPKKPAE